MIRCIAIDDEPLALRQVKNYIERIDEMIERKKAGLYEHQS